MDLYKIYQGCNHTELYQLCRSLGLPLSPSANREQLMQAHMTGVFGSPNPIDEWRNGLAGFVLDHWKVLQNQVTCPLQSQDPNSCFGCLDTQVITCIVSNPSNEHEIERYKR
jgi:hypothetical protein